MSSVLGGETKKDAFIILMIVCFCSFLLFRVSMVLQVKRDLQGLLVLLAYQVQR